MAGPWPIAEAGGSWWCCQCCLQVCPTGRWVSPRAAMLPTATTVGPWVLLPLSRFGAVPALLVTCTAAAASPTLPAPCHTAPTRALSPALLSTDGALRVPRPWVGQPHPRLRTHQHLEGVPASFHSPCLVGFAGAQSWLSQVGPPSTVPPSVVSPRCAGAQRYRWQRRWPGSRVWSMPTLGSRLGKTVSFLPAPRGERGRTCRQCGHSRHVPPAPRGAGDVPSVNAVVSQGVAVTSLSLTGSPGTPREGRAPRVGAGVPWALGFALCRC